MPSSSSIRRPLSNSTNSPPRSLRRKPSERALQHAEASSDSYFSTPSSIYEGSLENDPTPRLGTPDDHRQAKPSLKSDLEEPIKPTWNDTVCGTDGRPVPASYLQPISASRKDHIPHELYPITEQNSLATLRSRLSSLTVRGLHGRSLSSGLKGSHKKSFSLGDLPARTKLKPSSSESTNPPDMSLPQPNRPVHRPPRRTPTPPDIPSFGTLDAINYILPPPPKIKRAGGRWGNPTPEELEWRSQTVGLPKGVVMRGEGGVVVRGKFNGIRSGHLPPQRQQHTILALPRARSPPLIATSNAAQTQPDTSMGWSAATGTVRRGPSSQQQQGGTQADESLRIMQEVEARTDKQRRQKTERRVELMMKVLFCCCPVDGATGNETGGIVPQRDGHTDSA